MKTSLTTLVCAAAATALAGGSAFSAEIVKLDSDEAHADAQHERAARSMPANRSGRDRQMGAFRRKVMPETTERSTERTVLPIHHGRGQDTAIEADR